MAHFNPSSAKRLVLSLAALLCIGGLSANTTEEVFGINDPVEPTASTSDSPAWYLMKSSHQTATDRQATFVEESGEGGWVLVKENTLSGTTEAEAQAIMDGTDVFQSGSWYAISNGASIDLGTTGEENWGPNLYDPIYDDFLSVRVDIDMPGTYKFEYAHYNGDYRNNQFADLTFGNSAEYMTWEHIKSNFNIPAEVEIISSDEIEITEAGTYYFGYYVTVPATYEIRIADFKLWRKSSGGASTYKVSYEANENADIKLLANGSEIGNNTYLEEGTEVDVEVAPHSGYEVTAVKANGTALTEEEGAYKFNITENTTVTVETAETVVEYNLSYAISEGAELAELSVENEAGEAYENNSAVEEGSVYIVKVTSNVNDANVVITVNGTAVEAKTSGNETTYTGTVSEDTEIDVKVTSGIENKFVNNVYYNSEENIIYAGKACSIKIYDSAGMVVYNAENVESANVEFLNNGFYIAEIDGYTLKFNK